MIRLPLCGWVAENTSGNGRFWTLDGRRRHQLDAAFSVLNQGFLEAIRCRQRSTLEKGNAHEEGQNRGCSGPAEVAIVVSKRSWHEISEFLWKVGDRHK